jgi:hypothetical protein
VIDPTDLRVYIYDQILSSGVPPRIRNLATHFETTESEARDAIAALGIGKTVLPHPGTGEIWMAGPFASDPTPYRVRGKSVSWWANCAWDMLGIAFIAGERVDVDAVCAWSKVSLPLAVSPSRPPDPLCVVHFLLPARQWYDDIGYT